MLAATANGAKTGTVTIPAGSSSASFFYGDTKAGTAAINAAGPGLAPVTARILDAFGNQTDGTAQVTLQSSCTIKGTLTRAAASGIATFPDLEIAGKPSGCTVSASNGSLLTDTSNAFNAD